MSDSVNAAAARISGWDDTTGADSAPFDRVEALARQLCAESGRAWDQPRTRRAHWRALANEQLAATPAADDEPVGSIVGLAMLACFGAGYLAHMVLA